MEKEYAAVLIGTKWRACERDSWQWENADFRYSAGSAKTSRSRAVLMAEKYQATRDAHPTLRGYTVPAPRKKTSHNGWVVKRERGKESALKVTLITGSAEEVYLPLLPTTRRRYPFHLVNMAERVALEIDPSGEMTANEALARVFMRGLETLGPEVHDRVVEETIAHASGGVGYE